MFGPKKDSECMAFAIEGFRVDVQFNIQAAMNQNSIDRDDLANRLGKTRAWVDEKLFADNANPSIVTLAKVFHVMGEELVLTYKPTTHKIRR